MHNVKALVSGDVITCTYPGFSGGSAIDANEFQGLAASPFDGAISQPFIVAYMTQALELSKEDTVLEVGTGSGYKTPPFSESWPRRFTPLRSFRP